MSNFTRRSVALSVLISCTVFTTNSTAFARGSRARPAAHHHMQSAEPRDEAAEDPAENSNTVEEVPAREQKSADDSAQSSEGSPGSELRSAIDKRFSPVHGQEGISLFNVVANILEMGVLLILIVSVPLCGSVAFCAMIWHFNKMLRGGKKPSIG